MQRPMSTRSNANSALELAATETVADTALIAAASDGYFTDTNRLMNTLGATLITSKTRSAEVRSLLEFPLASIPAQAVVTQVVLQIDLISYQLAAGHDWMTLSVFGYTGDGHLASNDASSGSLVGSLTLTGSCRPGVMDLKLTPFFVQKALSSGFAGLNLRLANRRWGLTPIICCCGRRKASMPVPGRRLSLTTQYTHYNLVSLPCLSGFPTVIPLGAP